jgi:multidrug efflux system membrane fusion protein
MDTGQKRRGIGRSDPVRRFQTAVVGRSSRGMPCHRRGLHLSCQTGVIGAREKEEKRVRSFSVMAVPARKGDMGIYVNALGTVTPVYTVTVKTRVDGQLMNVYYREGQVVNRGDLLAQIDPRPYEVQLAQAEGQLARDAAYLANARVGPHALPNLWKQDSVSRQQLDTQEALVRQYEGTVKADRAAIDSAKLQLLYCRICLPYQRAHRPQARGPGQHGACERHDRPPVITQLQPITVVFPIRRTAFPRCSAGFAARSGFRWRRTTVPAGTARRGRPPYHR